MINKSFTFPSTPHLITLPGVLVREDKVLSECERREMLANVLSVEEKIDGANLAISFDEDANLTMQNRGTILTEPFDGQWKRLKSWLNNREEILFDALGTELILCGEWCYATHSVYYDRLPDLFLGFDIYQKNNKRFWSVKKRHALLMQMRLFEVPMLNQGRFSLTEIIGLISQSKYASASAEGIYLRFDEGDWLVNRAKVVRAEFIQTMEAHWTRSESKTNRLMTKD